MFLKLLLAPLTGLVGRLCVLVEILARRCRPLRSLVGQTLRILEAKAEIVLSQLGTGVRGQSAANTFAHHGLLFALVAPELVVAAHPHILLPLLLVVKLSLLPQLVQARCVTLGIGEQNLIGGLKVIMTLKVLLLSICQVNRAI